MVVSGLLDHITPHVRHESLGYADALFSLVVLQQGSNDAGQRKCRAVESVCQFGLLVCCTTHATLQTLGLLTINLAHGAYLQPALLCLGIHLKVITDAAGEAHIAATQTQDTVWELQLLEQTFHVCQHLTM